MKAKKIIYEKLVNTGNFSHEKFGIEIELDDEDQAQDALNKAKAFIDKQIKQPTSVERDIAQKVFEFDNDDIPF